MIMSPSPTPEPPSDGGPDERRLSDEGPATVSGADAGEPVGARPGLLDKLRAHGLTSRRRAPPTGPGSSPPRASARGEAGPAQPGDHHSGRTVGRVASRGPNPARCTCRPPSGPRRREQAEPRPRPPRAAPAGPDDLRLAVTEGRESNLVLLVVDASGSMAARRRMESVKAAALSLLLDAYQRRDKVGLITFRGADATLALPPTSSIDVAARRLRELPSGGRTPLAEGLLCAAETLRRERSATRAAARCWCWSPTAGPRTVRTRSPARARSPDGCAPTASRRW